VTGPGKIGGPQFSPDGTHIAFHRSDPTRQTGIGPEIVVVRADGSDERVVVPRDPRATGHFAWTPDSASLVVANGLDVRPSSAPTPPYDQSLSIIDAFGVTEPRLLTPPLPRWPGRQWMVPTSALAQMFRPPAGDRIVAGDWESLDVFDAELLNVAQLGRAAIKGPEPYWVRWPTWSPDGSMILFGLDKGEFGWPDDQVGSFVMNADGTDVRELGHATTDFGAGLGFLFGGAWSPDGALIAYGRETSRAVPEGAIALVDVASGEERVLWAAIANPDLPGRVPAGWVWSPDGRSIVYVEHDGARPIVIDVATGQATELPWEVESPPSWQRIPLD
jgi:Tol biopolymer transport system component